MQRPFRTLASGLLASTLALTTLVAWAVAAAEAATTVAPAASAAKFDVQVLVLTMFEWETKPWLDREPLTRSFDVPGAYGPVRCTEEGLCVLTTGMGKTSAGLTTTAVLLNPQFDLSRTIFVAAGIAGTPPEVGTLGDAAWADFLIDFDLGHHILPETDSAPDDLFIYSPSYEGTAVYELNHGLVDLAYTVTKETDLLDGEKAQAYRALYGGQAERAPQVLRCDTVTGDNYWHGKELSALATHMVQERTGGKGIYCSTQMEDNATAGALARAGYLDRFLSLRTISNFDQPHAGQSVRESMDASSGGFPLSTENAYRVGKAFANYVMDNQEAVLAKTSGVLADHVVTIQMAHELQTTKAANVQGRTLVESALLAERIHATQTWAPASRRVKLERGGRTIELLTDRPVAIVDGKEVALEAGARIRGTEILLPLRFVAEEFGYYVGWDGETQTILIGK